MSIPSLSELLKGYQSSIWYLKVHPNRSKASNFIWVGVNVIDVRFVYGKLQMLVTPTDGDLSAWVDKEKLYDSPSTDSQSDVDEVASEESDA